MNYILHFRHSSRVWIFRLPFWIPLTMQPGWHVSHLVPRISHLPHSNEKRCTTRENAKMLRNNLWKVLAISRSPSRFLDQIFHLFERICADLVYRGGCSIHIQQPDFTSWLFVGQVQVKGKFKMNPTYPNWKILTITSS